MGHAPTIYDVAVAANPGLRGRASLTGADFAALGLPMLGGCCMCGATIAAYNAHPGISGYLVGSCCVEQCDVASTIEEAVGLCGLECAQEAR